MVNLRLIPTTLLIIGLLICSAFTNLAFGQGPSLTKDETVNYIDKKLKEVLSQRSQSNQYFILDISFSSLDDGYYELYIHHGSSNEGCRTNTPLGYKGNKYWLKFKATLFDGIKEKTNSSTTVGEMTLAFLKDAAELKWVFIHKMVDARNGYQKVTCEEDNPKSSRYTNYTFDFLKSDPTTANKLIKAFNHLAALNKAEDDPFGD